MQFQWGASARFRRAGAGAVVVVLSLLAAGMGMTPRPCAAQAGGSQTGRYHYRYLFNSGRQVHYSIELLRGGRCILENEQGKISAQYSLEGGGRLLVTLPNGRLGECRIADRRITLRDSLIFSYPRAVFVKEGPRGQLPRPEREPAPPPAPTLARAYVGTWKGRENYRGAEHRKLEFSLRPDLSIVISDTMYADENTIYLGTQTYRGKCRVDRGGRFEARTERGLIIGSIRGDRLTVTSWDNHQVPFTVSKMN
jgi:hypothetical protein